MLLFIWIKNLLSDVEARFNTSHVTLYPESALALVRGMLSFNTSHVTLYQHSGCVRVYRSSVSIHLMLLFIRTPKAVK